MSAAAPTRTRPLFEPWRREAGRPVLRPAPARHPDGGGLTLAQRLDRAWGGLLTAGTADCPVCGGRLERSAGGEGRCGGCGSSLG